MLSEYVGLAIASISGGIATYVAIRKDLAGLMARMNIVEKVADKAHDRIDSLFGAKKHG